jgi:very-short-patch-repair endonuclease
VVALRQLLQLGLSPSGVRSRAARGELHRMHRGVYAVGAPRRGALTSAMAAVLACGPEAVLSHRSAAGLWGIRPDARPTHDVTVPGARQSRKGIVLHRGHLHPADTTTLEAIPCTSVARTLLDLADAVDDRALSRAVEQAERNRIFDLAAVRDVLARGAGRSGAPRLRRAIAHHEETATRSELERRFLEVCEDAGLPQPQTNLWLEGMEVDFSWPAIRLVVETDGFDTHGSRQAFERDRARDQRLLAAGFRVMRVTWRQLRDDPDAVAERLRQAANSGATAPDGGRTAPVSCLSSEQPWPRTPRSSSGSCR